MARRLLRYHKAEGDRIENRRCSDPSAFEQDSVLDPFLLLHCHDAAVKDVNSSSGRRSANPQDGLEGDNPECTDEQDQSSRIYCADSVSVGLWHETRLTIGKRQSGDLVYYDEIRKRNAVNNNSLCY